MGMWYWTPHRRRPWLVSSRITLCVCATSRKSTQRTTINHRTLTDITWYPWSSVTYTRSSSLIVRPVGPLRSITTRQNNSNGPKLVVRDLRNGWTKCWYEIPYSMAWALQWWSNVNRWQTRCSTWRTWCRAVVCRETSFRTIFSSVCRSLWCWVTNCIRTQCPARCSKSRPRTAEPNRAYRRSRPYP
jgi:hypothetical protein